MRVALLVLSLLSTSDATGSQPAGARGPVTLPVPSAVLAGALDLPSQRPATILLDTIRLVHTTPDARVRQRAAAALEKALGESGPAATEIAPLPLAPAIWRDVVLGTQVPDDRLAAAILRDRGAALMYLGLSAMEEETLGWLASHVETLRLLRKRPGTFAAFGRSIRIRRGSLDVPGGDEAASLWKALAGTPPAETGMFVARLFAGDGRLAFLYDTIAHLDEPHRRFALGLSLPESWREERLRTVLRAFEAAAPEWRADEQPFARPPLDGAMLLSTVAVQPDGSLAPPLERRLWERVFRADALNEVPFTPVSKAEIDAMSRTQVVDASWLATRILTVPYGVGRRRLDMLLFAQRLFGAHPDAEALVATTMRGYASFPALMTALERCGIRDPATFAAAAAHAARLSALPLAGRRTPIAEFQVTIALLQRFVASRVLDVRAADRAILALAALDVAESGGYGRRFADWFRHELMRALPAAGGESIEGAVLAAMAGTTARRADAPRVTWEERSYLVDPAVAELRRLRLVRERQNGMTLDAALADEGSLADALVAIVYAGSLGDPEATAVTSGNVASRHDFGLAAGTAGSSAAWTLPVEDFNRQTSWRIRGSLLGLEAALARLTLRRLNPTEMPAEPRVGPQDRQTVMLGVALMSPFAVSNESRDGIAAAIRRGRARVAALASDAGPLDEVTRAAGWSEWRRRALEWEMARGEARPASRFSLLELMWLGLDREIPADWDAWGAAALPLTGCVCLEMPRPKAWEDDAGYAAAVLGTRAADVNLRVAEALADLDLPASLAASLAGYAMQDVLEHARLSRADDWEEFGRAARELPRQRMTDYVAALTAGGPLVPVAKDENAPHKP